MKNREVIYPDLKVPVTVQGKNRYNIQNPIHQRGEQTLNKQAKTNGEIKGVAANTNAVANWSYCRPKMCNLTTASNIYKQIRPSYILRSEDMVFKVTTTLKNH